jgi:uncharacterized protein
MAPKTDLLIVFYRNPELGKVKTRLAATVGHAKALEIYLQLSDYTQKITRTLSVDKVIYYSHHVDITDQWMPSIYKKEQQVGDNLGTRMLHAFAAAFAEGYRKVCIIGTDCLELTTEIIDSAFKALDQTAAVIGPAKDGGYYLLGMTTLHAQVFENKAWSTHTVTHDTIVDFEKLKANYTLLPLLSDVDVEEDLKGKLL